MRALSIGLLLLLFPACVAGPGKLSPEQQVAALRVEVFMRGELPEKNFEHVEEIKAVRCDRSFGRYFGSAEGLTELIEQCESSVIEFLKQKAALVEADAVVNIQCEKVPFLNNRWVAAKCEGLAVKWVDSGS